MANELIQQNISSAEGPSKTSSIKKKIYLIGIGSGGAGDMTREAMAMLSASGLVLGARRLLDGMPDALFPVHCERTVSVLPHDILSRIQASDAEQVSVLFSGDSGFYSGTKQLLPLLSGHAAYETVILPGISSVQLLASRLGRPWQDWALYSAHGVDCDIVHAVCQGKAAFFLTGGHIDPAALCQRLSEAGLSELSVTVGENLGYGVKAAVLDLPAENGPGLWERVPTGERILRGPARAFVGHRFSPLSVVLAEPAPRMPRRPPGLPDDLFLRREGIPMSKQETRALLLSKLAPTEEELCWDIGTGTGSVSIELAMQARAVYGVERDPAALSLSEENRKRLGAWNLYLLEGEAPEALEKLPKPDVVFVGGNGGGLEGILQAVHNANANTRVGVTAITLEALQEAYTVLERLFYRVEITQLSVSRGKCVGNVHMMLAQNPVYLIIGRRKRASQKS